jgi:hypothetical protein
VVKVPERAAEAHRNLLKAVSKRKASNPSKKLYVNAKRVLTHPLEDMGAMKNALNALVADAEGQDPEIEALASAFGKSLGLKGGRRHTRRRR